MFSNKFTKTVCIRQKNQTNCIQTIPEIAKQESIVVLEMMNGEDVDRGICTIHPTDYLSEFSFFPSTKAILSWESKEDGCAPYPGSAASGEQILNTPARG